MSTFDLSIPSGSPSLIYAAGNNIDIKILARVFLVISIEIPPAASFTAKIKARNEFLNTKRAYTRRLSLSPVIGYHITGPRTVIEQQHLRPIEFLCQASLHSPRSAWPQIRFWSPWHQAENRSFAPCFSPQGVWQESPKAQRVLLCCYTCLQHSFCCSLSRYEVSNCSQYICPIYSGVSH